MSSPVPYLSPAQLRAALGVRDLSDPGEGPHAIQILVDRAAEALSRELRHVRLQTLLTAT